MSEKNIPNPWPTGWPPILLGQRVVTETVGTLGKILGTGASICEDIYLYRQQNLHGQIAQPEPGYPIIDSKGKVVDAYYPQFIGYKPGVAEDVYLQRMRTISIAE